jgi:hypothetical protein
MNWLVGFYLCAQEVHVKSGCLMMLWQVLLE